MFHNLETNIEMYPDPGYPLPTLSILEKKKEKEKKEKERKKNASNYLQ